MTDQPKLLPWLKDLISMAEDGYKLHRSNAVQQEFLEEDRETLAAAKKYLEEYTEPERPDQSQVSRPQNGEWLPIGSGEGCSYPEIHPDKPRLFWFKTPSGQEAYGAFSGSDCSKVLLNNQYTHWFKEIPPQAEVPDKMHPTEVSMLDLIEENRRLKGEIFKLERLSKERSISFAEWLLADYEIYDIGDGTLGWILAGTPQKYTTGELYNAFIQSTLNKEK